MSGSRSVGSLSFIVGGVIGAGVALLYAPQSGPATRALLRRKTRESAEALADLKQRAVRTGAQLKTEASHLGSAIRAGVAEELGNAEQEVARLGSSIDRGPLGDY